MTTMTDIKHHLNDALLMAYSAGTLPEAFSLVVATHLSLCDECRARASAFDAVGGTLIDEGDSVEMSEGSLDTVLAMIAGDPSERIEPPAPKADLPAPLAAYIAGGLGDVKWKSIGMGVKQAILPTSKSARARLLYIPAGTAVPDHGHKGTELTLVLRGAFSDQTDYFGPGDVEIADEDLEHMPVAELGEDCICLAATDAPLQFSGMIPRLAQPFLKI